MEIDDDKGALIRSLSSVPKKAKYPKDDPDEPLAEETDTLLWATSAR